MKKNIFNVLKRPVLTEKSLDMREKQNRYVFEVSPEFTKEEIRTAVEKLFKVKVLKVRTLITPGKLHRMGRFEGYRPDYKKAVVTLKQGDKIDAVNAA